MDDRDRRKSRRAEINFDCATPVWTDRGVKTYDWWIQPPEFTQNVSEDGEDG